MKHRPLYLQNNMLIIYSITLMAVMGVVSVTPAFPGIKHEFGIDNNQVGLLITVFTLPGIFLSPFLGIIADRLGRKKVLIPSLFMFAVFGFACSFTHDYEVLLMLRFLQGVGGSAIGSLNITLIGDLYSGKERASAMGHNASVLSVGTAAFPAIGGGLAFFAWYYPFYLSLLAIPVGFYVIFRLKNPEPKNRQPIFAYLKGVYSYINNRNVMVLFFLNILTFVLLYGSYLTYLPLLMNEKFGAVSWQIGFVLSFASITTAITSSQLGKLIHKFGYRPILSFSFMLYIVSLAVIPNTGYLWLMLLPAAMFGLAQGLNIPILQTLLSGSAPIEYRAAFMSLSGMVLRLGQTLGPIFTGVVFVAFGMKPAFYAGSFIAIIMILLVVFVMIKPDQKN